MSSADTFTPDVGQRIGPNGELTYEFEGIIHATGGEFTGHVTADGIDLESGDTATPPNDRRIRWIRASDGAVIAELYGFTTAIERELELHTGAAGAGPGRASIRLEDDGPPDTRVVAGAAPQEVTVIRGDGHSSFARSWSEQTLALEWNDGAGTLDIYIDFVRVAQIAP